MQNKTMHMLMIMPYSLLYRPASNSHNAALIKMQGKFFAFLYFHKGSAFITYGKRGKALQSVYKSRCIEQINSSNQPQHQLILLLSSNCVSTIEMTRNNARTIASLILMLTYEGDLCNNRMKKILYHQAGDSIIQLDVLSSLYAG